MKTAWIALICLLFLALGSCSPSEKTVENLPTLATENADSVTVDATAVPVSTAEATATVTAGATTTIPTSTNIETGAWTNYQNTQAGYSVQYPSDWAVNESVGPSGEFITTFRAPNDEQGITVNVLKSEAIVEEIPDMPNTRCQQITISELTGLRCFDSLTFSISTTLIGHGRQYAIVAFGKHPDENIYQGFLESFTTFLS
jgi:hypothetical protein